MNPEALEALEHLAKTATQYQAERDAALSDAARLQKSIDSLVKEQEMNAKAWREVQQQSRPNQWDKNKF